LDVKLFFAGRAGSPLPAVVEKPAGGAHGVTRPTSESAEPKTFSDAEIIATVKPAAAPPFYAKVARPESAAQKKRAKAERKTPDDQTRLHINVGEAMGVVPIDIVNSIAGETGLPGNVVGKVDIRERHAFVDVSAEHANAILAKLNRAQIKGNKVKIKVA
jgi:hypothetical protein